MGRLGSLLPDDDVQFDCDVFEHDGWDGLYVEGADGDVDGVQKDDGEEERASFGPMSVRSMSQGDLRFPKVEGVEPDTDLSDPHTFTVYMEACADWLVQVTEAYLQTSDEVVMKFVSAFGDQAKSLDPRTPHAIEELFWRGLIANRALMEAQNENSMGAVIEEERDPATIGEIVDWKGVVEAARQRFMQGQVSGRPRLESAWGPVWEQVLDGDIDIEALEAEMGQARRTINRKVQRVRDFLARDLGVGPNY